MNFFLRIEHTKLSIETSIRRFTVSIKNALLFLVCCFTHYYRDYNFCRIQLFASCLASCLDDLDKFVVVFEAQFRCFGDVVIEMNPRIQ